MTHRVTSYHITCGSLFPRTVSNTSGTIVLSLTASCALQPYKYYIEGPSHGQTNKQISLTKNIAGAELPCSEINPREDRGQADRLHTPKRLGTHLTPCGHGVCVITRLHRGPREAGAWALSRWWRQSATIHQYIRMNT
jgi:hypothetical protein